MKTVDLSRNRISTKDCNLLGDFLAENPLCGNKLTFEDMKSIARALRSNTNLQRLDVTENTNQPPGIGLAVFSDR